MESALQRLALGGENKTREQAFHLENLKNCRVVSLAVV